MGWEYAHLHGFRVGQDTYGEPDPEFPNDIQNEHNVRLDKIANVGSTFTYDYDFGDSWEHDLKIEKMLPAEPSTHYPVCLDGQHACPPEDCGGPPCYATSPSRWSSHCMTSVWIKKRSGLCVQISRRPFLTWRANKVKLNSNRLWTGLRNWWRTNWFTAAQAA